MRFVLACMIALGFVVGSTAVTVPAMAAANDYVVAAEQQPPSGQIDVDISMDRGGDWWANPVWIGVGILALILLVAIVAMASRGGTTVIKG